MPVCDCQRAFGLAAIRAGIGVVSGVVPGLTDGGHLDLDETNSARGPLERIFDLLGGDPVDLGVGSHRLLQMDFVVYDSRLIIEVDESQHFTSDRLRTLDAYPPDADLCFSLDDYKSLCRALRSGQDKYFAAKEGRGFRRPGGRRAQRAYLDAVRDLAAPTFGWRVFRVPAGHGDGTRAFKEAHRALAALL